jgi:hypothetical protein
VSRECPGRGLVRSGAREDASVRPIQRQALILDLEFSVPPTVVVLPDDAHFVIIDFGPTSKISTGRRSIGEGSGRAWRRTALGGGLFHQGLCKKIRIWSGFLIMVLVD